MAEVRRRQAALGKAAVMIAVTVGLTFGLTGCSGMNENDASARLTAAAESTAYAATVEVQHPDAPWVNKIVVRVYARDGSAEGVAAAVSELAAELADDPDLGGDEITFLAYEGRPEDNNNIDNLRIMGSVSEIVGGRGKQSLLVLSEADIQRLAEEQ